MREKPWARRPSHRNHGQNAHATSNFEQFLHFRAGRESRSCPGGMLWYRMRIWRAGSIAPVYASAEFARALASMDRLFIEFSSLICRAFRAAP